LTIDCRSGDGEDAVAQAAGKDGREDYGENPSDSAEGSDAIPLGHLFPEAFYGYNDGDRQLQEMMIRAVANKLADRILKLLTDGSVQAVDFRGVARAKPPRERSGPFGCS